MIVGKWGFYGFVSFVLGQSWHACSTAQSLLPLVSQVFATMMSLLSTHYILYLHRKVHYHSHGEVALAGLEEEKRGLKALAGLSNTFLAAAGGAILVSLVFYAVGFAVNIYQVTDTRGDVSFSVDYSVLSVGTSLPESQLNPHGVGVRFIQAMWFFLCVVMPLWCSFLFGLLYLLPLPRVWMEPIFFMGEIAFAWSCAEVLLVATIFSVLQMPTFGDGLIQADCTSCFVVGTSIFPTFAYLCVGSALSVGINVWLYRKAHHLLYGV